ncbi:MAG: hypothetical protein A2Y02_01455 [Omnitrophica bacterium GWA2_52_12]|nr:MAG: hypothetical protein A2Y02_01455 [Omnitrophica bacterium GWA2_52_12]
MKKISWLRWTVFSLFVVTAGQAAVEAGLTAAAAQLSQGHYPQALRQLAGLKRMAEFSIRWQQLRAAVLWKQWEVTKQPDILRSAIEAYAVLNQRAPKDATARFYLGKARLQLAALGKTEEQAWPALKEIFEEAARLEPGNAWLQTQIGIIFFSHPGLISTEESAARTRHLKTALSWHYRFQSSPYLTEVYQTLWPVYQDADVLLALTPEDAKSYEQLLQFLEARRLWPAYARAYTVFTVLRQNAARELCEIGDRYLERRDLRHARYAYEASLEILPAQERAKAGLRAALPEKRITTVETRLNGKLDEVPTRQLPSTAWWSETLKGRNRLDQKALSGVALHLTPGRSRISVVMRAEAGAAQEPALVMARLWNQSEEQSLAPAAVTVGPLWERFTFDGETSGGGRWLQLEFYNGSEKSGAGPVLWLGTVRVETIS